MVISKVTPEQILDQADTCVKCGLCLPHCPTYRKNYQESDSPRGRIALVQGLLSGALQDTPQLADHLDRCLECHACESICPSEVPVTRIIDEIRALQMERRAAPWRWLRRRLLDLAIHPAPWLPMLRLYQNVRLRSWLQTSGLLRWVGVARAERLLPDRPLTGVQTGHFPARGSPRGQVALFPGCLGRYLDAPALHAATEVLTHLGYAVTLPEAACCCGALHRHEGFPARGDAELERTITLFDHTEYDRVLVLASACLGELRHAPTLAARIEDATRFVADLTWPADLFLDATPHKIWVHTPCTQRHLLGDTEAAVALLKRIPGVNPIPLPDNETCCGAAGTYMLRQPDLSQALLANKLQLIGDAAATLVVTTNTGCALRLATGLRDQGTLIKVCHPLEILATRLPQRLESDLPGRQNGTMT